MAFQIFLFATKLRETFIANFKSNLWSININEDKGSKSLLNKYSHIILELSSEMAIDTSEDVDLFFRKNSNCII